MPIAFSFRRIRPTDIQQVICDLNSGTGTGPDGLEMKLIEIASHVLAYPLSDLAMYSMFLYPHVKLSELPPLHKGGDPLNHNYRPIAIINSIAKVFEKFIFNQLSQYVNDFSILSPYQSGFRPYFSITTALLKFTNDISSSLDNIMLTDAIFIDLTKAFDMVDHYLLHEKLYAFVL